jgi:hypothetical protein
VIRLRLVARFQLGSLDEGIGKFGASKLCNGVSLLKVKLPKGAYIRIAERSVWNEVRRVRNARDSAIPIYLYKEF